MESKTIKSIAFISPRFSESGTVGGAETLLKSLAIRAAAAGCDVTFLTTCAESHFTWENTLPAGEKSFKGMMVEYFPVDEDRDIGAFLRVQEAISRRARFSIEEERIWIENSVNSKALCDHLKEKEDRYDAIIAGPYLFGLIFHAALIYPEKTWMVPCLHDEPFAYLQIMHELFESVRGFMFNAEPERDLARRLFDIPMERCSVVGIGLDEFNADPNAFSKRHGLNQPYIIFCGRREAGKGTPLLVDYFRTFRERTGENLTLVFTGSGPIDAPVELEPYILDVGFVSEQEKHEAMAGAAAFVHPSVNESLGIVLLESWLAQTPGLVHDKCEVLKWQCRSSGAGFWFRNYPEFEHELLICLHDEDINQALGKAGRDYVIQQYAWERVEHRMFEALNRI